MTRALFVVDVQNDFTEGGPLAVPGGDEVARVITSFLDEHANEYDEIIGSRDWHDADSDNDGHFAAGAPDFVDTWPVHCVAGTPGADYDPLLDTSAFTRHVKKGQGTASYSMFEGTLEDGRMLADLIRDEGITEVDVVGLATDYCVLHSARDAVAEGVSVRIFTDLIAGVAAESSQRALAELEDAGVDLERANI